MKKLLAMALVIAFAMAFVPATLAQPASNKQVNTNEFTMDRVHEQKVADVNGNVMSTSSLRSGAKVATTENINKNKLSMTVGDSTKGYWDTTLYGFEEIDPESTTDHGYVKQAEDFAKITDWYNDGHEVYCQRFTTIAGDELKAYNAGDTVWFNYDLYQSWGAEPVSLPEIDGGYDITLAVFAGSADPEGNISLGVVEMWSTTEAGISVSVTAPEDDTYYIFVIVIDEVQALNDNFCGFLTISGLEKKDAVDFKAASKGAEAKVGTAVKTNVGASDLKGSVVPQSSMYAASKVQAHKIQLEGGKHYVAEFASVDEIGVRIWFCDENMDVINYTYVPAQAITEYGYDYTDFAMAIWPAVTGTYYMVVGGYAYDEEGTVDLTIMNWDDCSYAEPIDEVNETIDLDSLGTTDYYADGNIWGYHWFSESKVGMLIVAYPGTYTLKGDGSDIFVTAYDGVKLVYDNAKTAALKLANDMAPVLVEAKGQATIADNELFGYSIFNDEGATAGVYITGENLTIEGIFGIVLEGAPAHLGAKKLVVDTKSMTNYYPIATWVCGQNLPALTFGGNAKLDGLNQKATLCYDAEGFYAYGYAISEEKTLCRPSAEMGWDKAVLYYELTTDGSFNTDAGLLGDANLDGKVNTGDATTVLKHAAMMIELTGQAYLNADMNGDGNVNTGDATAILKKAAEG